MKTLSRLTLTLPLTASTPDNREAVAARVHTETMRAIAAASLGGLSPSQVTVTIEVDGCDALAEIVEAAANGAQHGNGIDRARWERYAMRRAAGDESND
jgi:hypothetical protein